MGRNVFPLTTFLLLMLTILLVGPQAFANSGITYHGRILKSDDTPVSSTTTQFRIQIRTPGTENCLLWEEQQTKDLSGTNGVFTITIADTAEPSLIPNALPYSLDRIFSNRTNFTALTNCTVGTTYNPSNSDGRTISVLFRENGTLPWEQIPLTKINFVPLALNSLQLEGFQAAEFLKVDPASSYTTLTPANVNSLVDLITGASTVYIKPADALGGDLSGTHAAATVTRIRNTNVVATAPTLNQVLKFNGTNWAPAADDTGTAPVDASYTAKGIVQFDTNLATSGISVTAGVASLPNTIVAGGPTGGVSTIPVITYDVKGRLTAVTTATVDDTTKLPLAGGTMTGPINMGTQNITNATSVAATNFSGRNLVLNDNDTNTVTIRTPTDITANYVLQLPPDDGTSNQILTTDGAGILTWTSPASGISVTANQAVVANGTGTGLSSFTCALNQVMGFDGAGLPQCQNVTAAGGFINGGNSFGSAPTLGTNDNFALNIETNGTTRMTIRNDGHIGIGVASPGEELAVKGNIMTEGDGLSDANSSISVWDGTNSTYLNLLSNLTTPVIESFRPGTGLRNLSFNTADVGIGTATPTSKLEVKGTTTDNTASGLNITDSAGASKLFVRNDGNVGVGTTSPTTALDVNGAFSQRGMAAPAVSPAGQGRIYFDSTSNTFKVSQNNGAYVDLLGAGGGSITGLTTNRIPFAASATSLADSANLSYNSTTGTVTLGGTAPGLTSTSALNLIAGGSNEDVIITPSGTGSAEVTGSGQLQLSSNNNAQLRLNGNAVGQGLEITNSNTTGKSLISGGTGMEFIIDSDNNNTGDNFTFVSNASTELMRISDTGNVGIGTTSPNTTLDVNGAFSQRGMAAPAVSPAGQGRIYFDSTSNKFLVSQNNGAYVDLVGSSGATALTDLSDAISDYADGNLFVGQNSGAAQQAAAAGNTALGMEALRDITTGDGNMAAGAQALSSNTTGAYNTAIGAAALAVQTGRDNNTALGYGAGYNLLGSDNVSIGTNSLSGSGGVGGAENVAVGSQAMRYARGDFNTAIGGGSMQNDNVGNSNTAVGNSALVGQNPSTFSNVTAVGADSLFFNQGSYNTAVGDSSLYQNTTGTSNTAFGYQAGDNITTGSNNIVIGSQVDAPSSVADFQLNIGNLIYGDLTAASRTLDVNGSFNVRGLASAPAVSPAGQGRIYFDSTTNKFRVSQNNGAYADLLGGSGTVSGTTGRIAKFTSGTAVGDSVIREAGSQIGIGKAPGYTLDVNGNGRFDLGGGDNIYMGGSRGVLQSSSYTGVAAHLTSDSAATNTVEVPLVIANYPSGTTPTAGNGTALRFDGYFTNNFYEMGQVSSVWTNLTLGTRSADLLFSTVNNAGALGERMRVTSTGNVGIGTTSPNTTLDVSGAFSQRGMAAPAVSPAGQGRIYYDSTANKFKVSQNNGAYVDLVGGSGSGPFLSVDGTAGAPSFSFSNDTNTGIFSPYPDAIGFSVGGANLFSMDANAFYGGDVYLSPLAPSSGQPSYAFNGDDNTGIYSPSADTIRLSTNAVDRMTLDSSGNVGIGTTSPTTSLDINGGQTFRGVAAAAAPPAAGQGKIYFDSTANKFKVSENNGAYVDLVSSGGSASGTAGHIQYSNGSGGFSSDTNNFFWDATNNRLGINTNAPGYSVDVVGGVNTDTAYYVGGVAYMSSIETALNNGTAVKFRNTNSTAGSSTEVIGGASASSYLRLQSTSANGTTDSIRFNVDNNGGTEAMRIINNGNIGIGTTTPGYTLEVNKSAPAADLVKLQNSSATGFSDIVYMDSSGTERAATGYGNASVSQTNLQGKAFFMANGVDFVIANYSNQNLVTVQNAGNVGIGTTSPDSILDINGAFSQRGMAVPAVSPAGQGRIYFDSTSNKFRVSQNNGAYTDLVNTMSGFNANQAIVANGSGVATSFTCSVGQVLGFDASGFATCTNVTASGGFINNGNSFGAIATLGTNDSQALAFETNSLERVRIDSAGNVGVGTTAPLVRLDSRGTSAKATTAALSYINQVGSTDATGPLVVRTGVRTHATTTSRYGAIEVDDNGTKRTLALQPSGGSVGIGTSSPDQILHVHSATTSSSIRVTNNDTAGMVGINFGHIAGGDYAYVGSTGGNAGAPWNVMDQTLTLQSAIDRIMFGSWTDIRMSIVGGDVGIGTTSPGAKLEVAGQVKITGGTPGAGKVLTSDASGLASWTTPTGTTQWTTSGSDIYFANHVGIGLGGAPAVYGLAVQGDDTNSNTNPSTGGGIVWLREGATGNQSLGFGAKSGGSAYSWIQSFDTPGTAARPLVLNGSGGNVGIGTTSPGALLQLGTAGTSLGTMRLTGNTSGYVQLQSAAAAGSWTMTLPSSPGTNGYVLSTDGSGVTSWIAQSGGGASSGTSGHVQFSNGSSGFSSKSSQLFWDNTNDRLGIGTATPATKLDVNRVTAGGGVSIAGTFTTDFGFAGTNAQNMLRLQNMNGPSGSQNNELQLVASGTNKWGVGNDYNLNGTNDFYIYDYMASLNRFYISSTGNVGIGTTSPQTTLQVAGVISPATNNTYTLGNATYRFTEVYATNGVINTSDRREKKEIYNSDLGLDFINQLRPVSYRWDTGVDNDIHYGLIAQEAEQVLKQVGKTESTSLVTHDKTTDRYGVRYSELISPIIKAVQELYQKLTGVDREIASIKAQAEIEKAAKDKEIAELKARLEKIEQSLNKK